MKELDLARSKDYKVDIRYDMKTSELMYFLENSLKSEESLFNTLISIYKLGYIRGSKCEINKAKRATKTTDKKASAKK